MKTQVVLSTLMLVLVLSPMGSAQPDPSDCQAYSVLTNSYLLCIVTTPLNLVELFEVPAGNDAIAYAGVVQVTLPTGHVIPMGGIGVSSACDPYLTLNLGCTIVTQVPVGETGNGQKFCMQRTYVEIWLQQNDAAPLAGGPFYSLPKLCPVD